MAIKKLSDLVVGEEYFVCWARSPNLYHRIKLLGFVNALGSGNTEIYFQTPPKNWKSNKYCFVHEIGIGVTRREAKSNFGQLKFEDLPLAYKSFEKMQEAIHGFLQPHWSSDQRFTSQATGDINSSIP